MECMQQSVTAARFSLAPSVAADRSKIKASSAQQACISSRPFSSQGSSASSSSFRYNALVSKVPAVSKRGANRAVVEMRDTAAGNYASALVDLAKSSSCLEAVFGDMERLDRYLSKGEVYGFLINPIITIEKKKEVLQSLAKEGMFQGVTQKFLFLLLEKKRLGILKDVIQEFEAIYNELSDTQIAVVTSAVKIENHQLAQIAKKVQSLTGAKNVKLKNVIDPSLIAGFMVNFGKDGSQFIDLSVKGQLERISASIELSEKVGAF